MTGALVITWGAPVRGREAKSIEVFGKALALMAEREKRGQIHGHREYLTMTGNTGTFSGLQIVDGELAELQKLQVEEQFQRLLIEANSICENFTVTLAAGGTDQAVQQEVTRYVETLQGLGYIG